MGVRYDNRLLLEQEILPHINTLKIDADVAYFANLTDLHVGSNGFDEEALQNFINLVLQVPNFYVHIGGDASNHANRGSKSSQFDDYSTPKEQIKGRFVNGKLERKGLVQLFEPLIERNRIVGITDGNHNTTRLKDFNDMSGAEYFSDITGVPYFGALAIHEFVVGQGKNSYVNFIHHSGSTGKRKNLNALQDRVFHWEADVHWGEHTHKDHYGRDTVVYYDRKNKKPLVRDRVYVNGNSYQSWGGYAKDKLYDPNTTGAKVLEFSGKRGKWDIRVYERVKDFVELVYNKM